ncbi:hypothetical protein IV57_GL000507 [Companilactobacillus kimchiensis]|uniref:Uncharacterized protein n=2 Tax=Companilactobacillus kimchiensis TaxID=993692 RepID=A0A0R2LIF8_9LACO|nr:hypothetical protein IV57_GL000507 [Companilactobacillus kimchiensis]
MIYYSQKKEKAMKNKRLRNAILAYILPMLILILLNLYNSFQPVMRIYYLEPIMILLLSLLTAFTSIKDNITLIIYFFVFYAFVRLNNLNGNWNAQIFAAVCGIVGTIVTYYTGKYILKGRQD